MALLTLVHFSFVQSPLLTLTNFRKINQHPQIQKFSWIHKFNWLCIYLVYRCQHILPQIWIKIKKLGLKIKELNSSFEIKVPSTRGSIMFPFSTDSLIEIRTLDSSFIFQRPLGSVQTECQQGSNRSKRTQTKPMHIWNTAKCAQNPNPHRTVQTAKPNRSKACDCSLKTECQQHMWLFT